MKWTFSKPLPWIHRSVVCFVFNGASFIWGLILWSCFARMRSLSCRPIVFMLVFPHRAHVERSAAPDARAGGLWDPAAGQLPRILHSGHALPDGRDAGDIWILCVGGHEFVRPLVRWRSWEVRKQDSWTFLCFVFDKFIIASFSRRYLAEWITYGYPSANVWPLDIKRFGNLQSSRTFLRHRVMEVMREYETLLLTKTSFRMRAELDGLRTRLTNKTSKWLYVVESFSLFN